MSRMRAPDAPAIGAAMDATVSESQATDCHAPRPLDENTAAAALDPL
jgi:hypothetical protein